MGVTHRHDLASSLGSLSRVMNLFWVLAAPHLPGAGHLTGGVSHGATAFPGLPLAGDAGKTASYKTFQSFCFLALL